MTDTSHKQSQNENGSPTIKPYRKRLNHSPNGQVINIPEENVLIIAQVDRKTNDFCRISYSNEPFWLYICARLEFVSTLIWGMQRLWRGRDTSDAQLRTLPIHYEP